MSSPDTDGAAGAAGGSGLSRRVALGALPVLPAVLAPIAEGCGRAPEDVVLERAARWLIAQQAPDGAFPSRTYGFFRRGQSLTPFVLLALLDVPREAFSLPAAVPARALGAIRSLLRDGALGLADTALDYPVYASAMALSCFARLNPSDPAASQLRSFLLSQQLAEGPGRGGFPMGGSGPPDPRSHVDLSMTRRAIEALVATGVPDGARRAARDFVLACRTADGGFVYTPTDPSLNKGLRDGDPAAPPALGDCRSYGSATADGILALTAIGADDPALPAARARLAALVPPGFPWDRNPGLDGGPMHAFGPARRAYFRAAAARALPAGPFRTQLGNALRAEQLPDGSFANPSKLQKEDDPLIATAFALSAMCAIR